MKEALRLNTKSVFTKIDKEERLDFSENLRKNLNSVFENLIHIINILFDLIDDVSLLIIDKAICVDNYITPMCDDRNKAYDKKAIFIELRNSSLNTLVKRSKFIFVAL